MRKKIKELEELIEIKYAGNFSWAGLANAESEAGFRVTSNWISGVQEWPVIPCRTLLALPMIVHLSGAELQWLLSHTGVEGVKMYAVLPTS